MTYLVSVLITLLMIFCLCGLTGAALIRGKALRTETFRQTVRSQDIPARVHTHLAAFFAEQENTTGIPASVYERAITEDRLNTVILETVTQASDYLDGRAGTVSAAVQMPELEEDLRAFFASYASENGYAQDSTYDELLTNAILSAKNNIRSSCDVFRFSMLADAGLMKKAQRAVPYTKYLMIGCGAGIAVLLMILLMLHRKDKPLVLYWLGSAVLVGSLLLLIPAAWLQLSHWFDRFAVKSDHVFAAVTGYLYTLTGTAVTAGAAGIVLALCLFLFCGMTRRTAG